MTIRFPIDARLDDASANTLQTEVSARVREIRDFPRPGIVFRDVTPVLAHAETLRAAMALLAHAICDLAGSFDKVAAIEARGFLFGMALAERFGVGFVPIRKPGKLPAATLEHAYALEYGVDRLQIHADAVAAGDRVVIVDDLLATGGTARAASTLVERLGGRVVAAVFLIELVELGGRDSLGWRRVESCLRYV